VRQKRNGLFGRVIFVKYRRPVKPSKVLPPSLIRGYYEKDAETLVLIQQWLEKNGLTILFTLEEAYGNETVWLDEDGLIYIGTAEIPKKKWLKKCLVRLDRELFLQSLKEKWSTEKYFVELKKALGNPSVWYNSNGE
jgi:hypothetical protein